MKSPRSIWAVVLAAGDGTRLDSLTRDAEGKHVPKQFCSLDGGPTLLQQALKRGRTMSGRQRLCAVVARQHEQWWSPALLSLTPRNIFVQAADRGTANGVLWPLLEILAQDPLATVLFLPADHYVADERRLRHAMRQALQGVDGAPEEVTIIGIEPREIDTDLGYILPEGRGEGSRTVRQFIEKPDSDVAMDLVLDGALWSTMIVAARGVALLDLLRRRMPHVVAAMASAVARSMPSAMDAIYAHLPDMDLSHDILTGSEASLRVVTAMGCGWTDIGTPRRVANVVASRQPQSLRRLGRRIGSTNYSINLSEAYRVVERKSHVGRHSPG